MNANRWVASLQPVRARQQRAQLGSADASAGEQPSVSVLRRGFLDELEALERLETRSLGEQPSEPVSPRLQPGTRAESQLAVAAMPMSSALAELEVLEQEQGPGSGLDPLEAELSELAVESLGLLCCVGNLKLCWHGLPAMPRQNAAGDADAAGTSGAPDCDWSPGQYGLLSKLANSGPRSWRGQVHAGLEALLQDKDPNAGCKCSNALDNLDGAVPA